MKKFFFLMLLVSFFSYAQQSLFVTANDSAKTYPLKEVIVSATKSEKNLADVGRSVTVITNEQTKNFLYQSMGELLTQQAGMYIVGAGQNPGMVQSIFTRGAASNQTAIMVDDIRITDPSAVNNVPDLSELSFTGVDRLEIVRGSHSTLYGSSAIGGVLNFITPSTQTPGIHINTDITSGTFGKGTSVLSENLFLNYTDPVGMYFNAGLYNSGVKGLDATVDTVTNPNAFKNRDMDGFTKTDLFGKIGYRDDNFHFYLSYKNNSQKADLDKSAFVDDNNYTLDFKRNLFTYGASYAIDENIGVKYIGGYSTMKRIAVNDSSIADQLGNYDHTYFDATYQGTMTTNEIQGSIRANGIDGIIGVGLYKETMSTKTHTYISSFSYDSKTDLDTLHLNATTKNAFVHFDMNGSSVDETLRNFSLAVGVRLNNNDTFGNAVTYEINPSMKVAERSLFYLSYSTGFNAPSLYQMFTPEKYYTSNITRGNKNLKPENSNSFEIGFKQFVNDNVDFSIAYFNAVTKNFIEYVYVWDKKIGIDTLGNNWSRDDYRGDTYLNVGKQTTSGIELSLNSKINEKLFFAGNISFVSGKLTYDPSDVDTSKTSGNNSQLFSNGAFIIKQVESLGLTRRPNTANMSLTYKPIKELVLRIDAKIVGSRSDVYYDSKLGPFGSLGNVLVADYTILDFSSKFKINENISVNGRIENILNTEYSEIRGYTTRGRGIYLSVNYSL